MYTLVLAGHIELALIKFPKKTLPQALDVLARQFLFQDELNYMHGTGHGVGALGLVHEYVSIFLTSNLNITN